MDTRTDELAHRAADAFAASNFQASYRLASDGLRDHPEDPGLLALAGRAALELGLDDATAHLSKLAELSPDNAAAWRDLGMARLSAADLAGAERALRTAARLDPGEPAARVSLGHVVYMGGAVEEADRLLWEAAALAPNDVGALRSLMEMCRLEGRSQAALAAASELARRAPGDLAATMNLAELHLLLGNYAESLGMYRLLRERDTEPGHAGYVVHGMIEVEIRRERWRRALDLAITATSLDRHRLTTDLLAFVSAQLFGEADRPTPARDDLIIRLEARRAEHRRLHAEAFASGEG